MGWPCWCRMRARPSLLSPLVRLSFGLAGAASAMLGREQALNVSLTLQKVLEDNVDESLRVLTEAGVSDPDLREVGTCHQTLQAIRNNRYVVRRTFDEMPEARIDPKTEDFLHKAFSLLHRSTKFF